MYNKTTTEWIYKLFLESNQKICTDTRRIEEGSIFFALKGDNFNANEFSNQALEKGCSYVILDEEKYSLGGKCIVVEDVLSTLQALANYHRQHLKIPILGITGSNGKTTTKELIAAVLSKKFNVLATLGNLNNHIGVPLTLLSINPEHEFAIIEMGANHQGEIELLCQIAEPNFGLITNIGKAHLEGFGGVEGIKKGKSELYKFIEKTNGKIFINDDDEVLKSLLGKNESIGFGINSLSNYLVRDTTDKETISFKFIEQKEFHDWDNIDEINTNIIGTYNLINCFTAASIGKYFGVSYSEIKNGIENYLPNMNRSQVVKTQNNSIILDAYNANPSSMKAAIENFSKLNAKNKLALLGDMFELGEYAHLEHQAIVDFCKEKELKEVLFVGTHFKACNLYNYYAFETTSLCSNYLLKHKVIHNTVLIKGSRGMKMETLQTHF